MWKLVCDIECGKFRGTFVQRPASNAGDDRALNLVVYMGALHLFGPPSCATLVAGSLPTTSATTVPSALAAAASMINWLLGPYRFCSSVPN